MSEAQVISKVIFAVWWRIGIPLALFVFAYGLVLDVLFAVAPILHVTGSISHYAATLIVGLLGGDPSAFLGDDGTGGSLLVGFLRAVLDNLPILVVLVLLTRWQIRRHMPRILRDCSLVPPSGGAGGSG